MKLAFVSDIHGNLHALEAVLKDQRRQDVQQVVCLGDMVGYGAFPNEVIERIRETTDWVVAGNHDHAAVGLTDIGAFNQFAYNATLWTRQTLHSENSTYLKILPLELTDKNRMYVHAGPVHPEQWPYVFSDNDAERVMRYAEVKLVFIGHTHIPRDHQVSNGRLINVGSVGQPRDGDPRAAYTLFDTETGDRKLVRVDYDYEAAGQAIRKAGLPEFLAARIRLGR